MYIAVEAKFTCISITKRKGWEGHPFIYEAEFQAVTSGSYQGRVFVNRESFDAGKAEDEKFFAATPAGTIKLFTIAMDHFVVGKDYYVTFQPVG